MVNTGVLPAASVCPGAMDFSHGAGDRGAHDALFARDRFAGADVGDRLQIDVQRHQRL
jgi:hypothetical protein